MWRPRGSILVPWVTFLVIQGSTGHPTGTSRSRCFIDFRVVWEVPWDPLWRHFRDCSVIWGGKVGDSSQVRVFDDPGLEMLPECGGCICYNHCKTYFLWLHFCHLFTDVVSWGRVLGINNILVHLGDPGDICCDFPGSWRQAWNFMIFQGYAGRAQVERTHPRRVMPLSVGYKKQFPNSSLLTCKLLKAENAGTSYQTCRLSIRMIWLTWWLSIAAWIYWNMFHESNPYILQYHVNKNIVFVLVCFMFFRGMGGGGGGLGFAVFDSLYNIYIYIYIYIFL